MIVFHGVFEGRTIRPKLAAYIVLLEYAISLLENKRLYRLFTKLTTRILIRWCFSEISIKVTP